MSTSSIGDGPPKDEFSQVKARTGRVPGTSVRHFLVPIVGAGAILGIFWAGWKVWDDSRPVVAAVRGLRSSDPSQRAAAVLEVSDLGASASAEAIRAVLPVLADPDSGVRAGGAEALGVVGSYSVKSASASDSEATRAAVTALTGLLKDREPGVRAAAAGALGIIAGTAARPSSRRGQRGAGKSSAPAASPPPPDAVDPPAVVNSLLDLLEDQDAAVRQAALSALRDCASRCLSEPPERLLAAVDDESATNRAIALNVLANFSHGLDPVVPLLLRHLEQDEPQVRDACRAALGRIAPSGFGSALIPTLIAGLGTGDRDARLHVVSLLARMSPDARTAVPALIGILREPVDSDRNIMNATSATVSYAGPAQEAAKALGRIAPGTPAAGDAIAALAEIVRSGPAKRRAAAAEALGRFGTAAARAIPALIAFLQDSAASKEPTRDGASAASALGRIAPGTPSATAASAALTAALKSGSASTRDAALEALQSFKPVSPDAIAAIRAIEKSDPSARVRKTAASAREAIEGKSN